MTNREKIIIAVALLAAVYGVMDFFILSSPQKKDDTSITAGIQEDAKLDIIKKNLDALKSQILNQNRVDTLIGKIESEWKSNPFANNKKTAVIGKIENFEASEVEDLDQAFSYSGFIQFKGKTLAVINAVEYAEGEHLPDTNHKVIKITPRFVMLSAEDNQVKLFLQEE